MGICCDVQTGTVLPCQFLFTDTEMGNVYIHLLNNVGKSCKDMQTICYHPNTKDIKLTAYFQNIYWNKKYWYIILKTCKEKWHKLQSMHEGETEN